MGVDLHVLHFVVVAAWFGVVGVEFVMEIVPLRRPDLGPAVAVLHYWVDLIVELPLIVAVTATGFLILSGRPRCSPDDARLLVKLLGAAVALGANLVCVALVVWRHRGRVDAIEKRSRWVRATGIGIPGGLVALYLGLGYAGWL